MASFDVPASSPSPGVLKDDTLFSPFKILIAWIISAAVPLPADFVIYGFFIAARWPSVFARKSFRRVRAIEPSPSSFTPQLSSGTLSESTPLSSSVTVSATRFDPSKGIPLEHISRPMLESPSQNNPKSFNISAPNSRARLVFACKKRARFRFWFSALLVVFILAAFVIQGMAIWLFQRVSVMSAARKGRLLDPIWILPWLSWGLFQGAMVMAAVLCVVGLYREIDQAERKLWAGEKRAFRGEAVEGSRGPHKSDTSALLDRKESGKGKSKRIESGEGQQSEMVEKEQIKDEEEKEQEWQLLECHPTFLPGISCRDSPEAEKITNVFGEGSSRGPTYHVGYAGEEPPQTPPMPPRLPRISPKRPEKRRSQEQGSKKGEWSGEAESPIRPVFSQNCLNERKHLIHNSEKRRKTAHMEFYNSLELEGDVFAMGPLRPRNTWPPPISTVTTQSHRTGSIDAPFVDNSPRRGSRVSLWPEGEDLQFTGQAYPLLLPEKYVRKAFSSPYKQPSNPPLLTT
ncbi:MAG: hypothetical protein Q9190_007327, partial [Brigantiaea leucoxantha]